MAMSPKKEVDQSSMHESSPLQGSSSKPSPERIDKFKIMSLVFVGFCFIVIISLAAYRIAITQSGSQALRRNDAAKGPDGILSWPLVIDGKDAAKGPDAYNDHHFSKVLQDGLPFVLADKKPLTMELLDEIHGHCCSAFIMRANVLPMEDFLPPCFRSMDCAAQRAAIEGVPERFLAVTWDNSGQCPEQIHLRTFQSQEQVRQQLVALIDKYQKSLNSISLGNAVVGQGQPLAEDARLQALSTFLRGVAWLHPFQDGNGRLRTLLLQHEVRRLGLGPGAYMFNNNRDIFFESSATYSAKITEGVDLARQYGWSEQNPWLDKAVVEQHMARFQAPGKCHEGGIWGSVL